MKIGPKEAAQRAQGQARYEEARKPAPRRQPNRNASTNRNACLRCGTAIEQKSGGGHRVKEFCSPACKQKAYRERLAK